MQEHSEWFKWKIVIFRQVLIYRRTKKTLEHLPITTNKMEPYTRKLLYIILASFVKSPNIDNHGAIYVCCRGWKEHEFFLYKQKN